MGSDFFHILVHPGLLGAVKRQPGRVHRQLQKTLERLQLGLWDNGTRVKALRGVERPVYEARVNISLRLLFTVTTEAAPTPPYGLQPYVMAWDLVDHDHLDRARRLNVERECAFLDLEALAEAELLRVPRYPANALAKAPGDSASLLAMLEREADGQRDEEAMRGAIRWFALDPDVVADDAEWEALLNRPSLGDLELKLSPEQAVTVMAPGPVLLRGSAGSGKTTVCVYRLARAAMECPGEPLLFVTYSEALRDEAERLFHDLFEARGVDEPVEMPVFRTFPELYLELIGSGPPVASIVRYGLFVRWYETIYNRRDGALAWEEIRGIIKGSLLALNEPKLSLEAYLAVGSKRAPLFVGERERLYRVCERYEAWCRQERRCDDIDLARRALGAQARQPGRRYAQVICDEGQDLTELEMALLLSLMRDTRGLLLAADPQQIVNPSGFRWAELRTLLRERSRDREPPSIHGLSRNYRSLGGIVTLANALLKLKRDRTGRSDDDGYQVSMASGAPPVLVGATAEVVAATMRELGPGCAVITARDEEAVRLRGVIGSERVFSVVESKGLEFDAVLLWNVLGADPEVWTALVTGEDDMREDAAARRAIQHVYVAVTRGRRYLAVFEEETVVGDLWSSGVFRGLLEMDDEQALGKFSDRPADPAAWCEEGAWYRARHRFRQAAECFRLGGDERMAMRCDADGLVEVGDDVAAARLYEVLGEGQSAAEAWERAGRWKQAAEAWMREQEWLRAAVLFERAGKGVKAMDAYQKGNDGDGFRRMQRRVLEGERKWAEAARVAVRQDDLAGAISLYEKAGNREQAAELREELAVRERAGD